MESSDVISKNSHEMEKLSQNAVIAQTEISDSAKVMLMAVKKVDTMVDGYIDNGKEIQTMIETVESVNILSSENVRSVEEIATSANLLSSMTGELNILLDSYKT